MTSDIQLHTANHDEIDEVDIDEAGIDEVMHPDNIPEHSQPVPDAPLTRLRIFAIRLLHTLVMLGIVALFLRPVLGVLLADDRSKVRVTVVAEHLVPVRAQVEGEFRAERTLLHGTYVEQGTLLGVQESERLDSQVESRERQLESLRRRKLLLDQMSREAERTEEQRELDEEIRRIGFDTESMETELKQLRRLQRNLEVRAPVSGYIHYGLSANQAARKNEPLAYIWPVDGQLVVELEGPQKAISALIGEDVEAIVLAESGEVSITARPIPATIRTTRTEGSEEDPRELLARVQCRPVVLPEAARVPGLNGWLKLSRRTCW